MSQENGLWVYDESKIVEVLGNYIKNWLEDNLPEKLYEEMDKTISLREENITLVSGDESELIENID